MESPFADAMSSTDQHGTACHWSNWTWRDAEGNVLIDACSIPPHVKDHIREGLRAKKLCWEYLYESGFMSLIGEAHTPAEAVENALKVMIHAENKPNPGKNLSLSLLLFSVSFYYYDYAAHDDDTNKSIFFFSLAAYIIHSSSLSTYLTMIYTTLPSIHIIVIR
jgi:hypothetical protein